MALTNEWIVRIENWQKALRNQCYRKLGDVNFSGFTTLDRLNCNDAQNGDFKIMPIGTKWGKMWEYCWFKGDIILPEDAIGKRIALRVNVGGESVIYINLKASGAKDRQHEEITLTKTGELGKEFNILVESFSGLGNMIVAAGPVTEDCITIPEFSGARAEVGESTFGVWEEDAYQLWMDVQTLYDLRNCLDKDSLRVLEIDKALKEYTIGSDFEFGYTKRLEAFNDCRKKLAPLLECTNGSTVPTMYMFGHSHLDLAWMWPVAETERKSARTLSTQLALMDEYKDYTYLQSQPFLYKVVKELYPDLYKRIKDKVKSGQFIPEGGMWVESDTNLPSGESLIRQFIHGKKFFYDEFGIDNEILWLPDAFGYSGTLPQIMKGCGIKYFSTTKLFWLYNGGEKFPYNTFTWEGIDGSEVFVHLHNNYASKTDPISLNERWNERVQKEGFSTRLFPFGYGDGGGGATRDHLEFIKREKNLEGVPKAKLSTPLQYFKDQEKQGIPDARYVGELYWACHRGTYTSQAKTKKYNRKSEIALHEAEVWGAISKALSNYVYPLEAMDKLWKKVLFNQFHDILPGTSIARVYKEAEADYLEVIEAAENIVSGSLGNLIKEDKDTVTVFNSLSWQRNALIKLPDKKYLETNLPACGWKTIHYKNIENLETINNIKVSEKLLENELLRVELNDKGEIISIFDKERKAEITRGTCNRMAMYKDIPTNYEAWDIDSNYICMPVNLEDKAKITVLSSGPLFAKIQVVRKLNKSTMIQEISLRRNCRRIDFKTKVDWQERQKLLKVQFPVNIQTSEAIHEIQFGYIKRPNHKSRQFDLDRFEVCNHKWSAICEENHGSAILNDSKYGINVLGNSMNLTLLRSPLAPDMNTDRGLQQFVYSFYSFNGSFADSDVIKEAYELNYPAYTMLGDAGERSIINVSEANIIVETIKPSEDGSGDIIIRLYEAKRMTSICKISIFIKYKKAIITDMLENKISELNSYDGELTVEFKPFQIKTIRLVK